MNLNDIMVALVEWEEREEDTGAYPAFLLNCSDEELDRARDFIERAKMHVEDVINYHCDMDDLAAAREQELDAEDESYVARNFNECGSLM